MTKGWKRFHCDVPAHVCGAETTILEVMGRLDEVTPYLFQVVIDGDNRILGTVTDGDIRRALLRGVTVSDPVSRAMKSDPVVGRDGDAAFNEDRIRQMSRLRTSNVFLPLVDGDDRLARILVLEDIDPDHVTALIMAGGKGKRLGSLTSTTPKPLIEVAGRPMLDHILEKVEAAGIKRIYISVFHLAEKVEQFLKDRPSDSVIRTVFEDRMLGTAGAVAMLPDIGEGSLMVMNGDVLSDVNLEGMLNFHNHHEYNATVGAAHYEHEVPFGVIEHDQSGVFEGVVEKPRHQHYVSAGINVLSASMRALVPVGRYMDMPDLLNSGREAGLRIGIYPIHEYWTDLGHPVDLEAARPPSNNGKRLGR